MARLAATLLVLSATFALSFALAHEGMLVTLVLRDGTHVPFTIELNRAGTALRINYCTGRDACTPAASVGVDADGVLTLVPVRQIARADLVAPGRTTVWRFTLRDGRSVDGFLGDGATRLGLGGLSWNGVREGYWSYARQPNNQPFIAVIFGDAVPLADAPVP